MRKTETDAETETQFNFTVRGIAAKPAPVDKRVTYHDTQVPELGLMIQKTGHKSFFWFRKVRGVGTWKTIGAVSDISLEQARDAARQYSTDVSRWKLQNYEGDGPFEKRKGEPTFDELVEAYVERQVKPHAKRPVSAEKSVRGAIGFYLKDWKARRLSAIKRADVRKLHEGLGATHKYTANRCVQLVRLLFNFAVEAELYKGENPASRLKLFHEAPRTRFLQPDELARLFAALRNDPSVDLKDFVCLALWTGARKSDIFSMRWENVSLDDNRWTVPDPKNRKPYIIPLTPESVKVLKDRLKMRRNNNPWVFPSYGKSGHVEDLKGRWRELLKRAKITNLRIHDLRRTQGSWQAGAGVPLQVIGKSLGHSSLAATQVYAQLNLDPVRAAMAAANAAMMAAMKKRPKQLEAARA